MFPPKEVESFSREGNVIVGHLFDTRITVCRLMDVPQLKESVSLDLDIDYFIFDSALYLNRLKVPRIWPQECIDILQQKEIKTDLVTICYSVEQGYMSLQKGLYDKAAMEFHRTVEIRPEDPLIWYNMALVELLKGNFVAAISHLGKAIYLGGETYREMAKRDSGFQSLRDNAEFHELVTKTLTKR